MNTNTPLGRRPLTRPLPLAALLALGYVLLCAGYIFLSGRAAASVSLSVEELFWIEVAKGTLFVTVTGLLFFLFSWGLLCRVRAQQEEMTRQRQALLAAERQALPGLFASSVAHDVNNILIVAYAHLDGLRREAVGNEAADLTALAKALEDLATLARRLQTLGHQRVNHRERLDLSAVVREAVEFACGHKAVRHCHVETGLPEPLLVKANPAVLGSVVLNLVLNAAEATGPQGRIEVRLRRVNATAHLEIHDNGPGVPPDRREAVFEPFYTTKPGGTGLGLIAVKAGAEELGGVVTVTDSPLGGACFRVTVPLSDCGH